MRTLRLLITLAFAIVAVGVPITAQDDDDPLKPLYVYWQINEFATDDSAFAPGEAEMSPTFPRAVFRRILAETEYIPVFMGASNAPGYTPPLFVPELSYDTLFSFDAPTISARLDTFPEGDLIRLTPYAAFELPSLPLGTQGWSTSLGISPDDDAAIELGIQVALGMALYTAYDCDAALPYMDAALATLEAADEDAFDGFLVFENVQFIRGSCLYLQGDVDAAITAYEDILAAVDVLETEFDIDPRVYADNTRVNLAYLYLETGAGIQAIDVLDAAIGADLTIYADRELGRYVATAELYIAAGETDKGLNEFDRFADGINIAGFSLSESRLGARFHTERGRILLDLGRYQDSLAAFEQAVTADDSHAPTYYWRGVYYMDQGENELAIADFNTFLDLSESFFDYHQQNLAAEIEDARARVDELGG